MSRRGSIVYHLRESFWFLPAVMSLVAIGTYLIVGQIDKRLDTAEAWPFGGGAGGAQQLLAVIAGSSITVAGVVFSITMVTLSLAASQFGPRLIRNFMRDTGTQVVFGTMLATFVFSLLTLPEVRTGQESFVPSISLLISVALALASVAMLIFFIHHTAASVQAENVAARLGSDLHEAIHRHSRQRASVANDASPPAEHDVRAFDDARARYVPSPGHGFVQVVDYGHLRDIAASAGARFIVLRRPGGFVTEGEPIVATSASAVELDSAIQAAYFIGNERTLEQDVSFGLEELVDVAVRALSPGVMLPFLAALCVNHIGAALVRLVDAGAGTLVIRDAEDEPRVLVEEPDFADLLDVSFSELRRNGADSMPTINAIYGALELLALQPLDAEQRSAVLHHAELLNAAAEASLSDDDRRRLYQRHEHFLALLNRTRA